MTRETEIGNDRQTSRDDALRVSAPSRAVPPKLPRRSRDVIAKISSMRLGVAYNPTDVRSGSFYKQSSDFSRIGRQSRSKFVARSTQAQLARSFVD